MRNALPLNILTLRGIIKGKKNLIHGMMNIGEDARESTVLYLYTRCSVPLCSNFGSVN